MTKTLSEICGGKFTVVPLHDDGAGEPGAWRLLHEQPTARRVPHQASPKTTL